ncbi:hypothetical protein [Nocardia sp. CA-135398]|uniref:hypothetical protein n=1 Tax=Nocardia sp. CA-135398 TaxID=3239977 RepID=UPI003D9892F4
MNLCFCAALERVWRSPWHSMVAGYHLASPARPMAGPGELLMVKPVAVLVPQTIADSAVASS